MSRILGVSAFYHDSAAAVLSDGEVVAAAQEERFTRKKHDSAFPRHAVAHCLDEAGLSVDELDAVVFYDKPFLKFERLLETYYAFAPRGLKSFLSAMPGWIKEKLMLKSLILDELSEIERFDRKRLRLLFPEHHLSHAASAFYPSPFPEAAVVTIDGVGEWATASICRGHENRLAILRELRFPHSVGLLYSAFTYFLGFRVNSGEYKLMGLAPYGDSASERVERYAALIRTRLVDVRPDGSIWLDQRYFDFATGLRMVDEDRWRQLFGVPARRPEEELLPEYCDLALAIQKVTEEIVLNMVREARRLTGSRYLCLAGGVALNCVANGKILKSGLFDEIWIQPAAGDAGGALGAAYCAHHIWLNNPREADGKTDRMNGAYLGPQYSEAQVRQAVRRHRASFRHYEDFGALCDEVAGLLDAGNVVAWHQGRMEWGPRALGNRSILADARNPEMQKKLNLKIKFREGFRPFAPSVLMEDLEEYFDIETPSPYMLLIAEVREERRKALPEGYGARGWREKLYHIRSDIPAVTHIDFSARLQTVHQETNPRYWRLLKAFKDRTGYGLVSNTSFNVRGEPIVCTPEDAYRCFMRTEIDYLVIGNLLFDKRRQPVWPEERDWRETVGVD
ncbi:MAG TPA: carbamoyltransferase [Methylomirabilota bacterium]|nr:carbamoyltransferase [Methylomirabilota bacterium]